MTKIDSHGIPDGYEKSLVTKSVKQKASIVSSSVKVNKKIFPNISLPHSRFSIGLVLLSLVLVFVASGVTYYILNRPVARYTEDSIVPTQSSKEFNSKYDELLKKREKNESYVTTEKDYIVLLGMPGDKPFYFYEEVAIFYENQNNKEKSAEYYKLAKNAYDNTQKVAPSYSAAKSSWYDAKISGEITKYEE